MTSSTAIILDQLDRISGRMELARRQVQTGQPVELAPLEAEIEIICSDIAALPPDERVAFRRPLTGLISELNDLTQVLRVGLERIGRELAETGQRRQATAAYGKSGSSSGGPDR